MNTDSKSNVDPWSVIAQQAGKIGALEFAVKLLIMTHPDREFLRSRWDMTLPAAIDWISEKGIFQYPEYRNSLMANLADMRQQLEKAGIEDDGDDG